MLLKIHKTPMGEVAALCDSELLGAILSEGAIRLDLDRHADFYRGEKVGEAAAIEAIRSSENVNIVGKRSLSAAKKAGVDTSGAISIKGVPHLQVYRL